MSDKNLTELEWKRFSKGRSLKDGAFVKSLAEVERAKTPDAQLSALAEIEKQADLLVTANEADKALADYLGDAGKAINKQRKAAEFEAKRAARDGGGDDDGGPAALGAKMLPLLRQIAKGDDGGGALPVMVAVAGKEVAVLVARRAIDPSQKKLLSEALGNAGGIKYMSGECLWEGNAHTFVLEAKVAKLAAGIKAALQQQTDTRFKVRVRGTDPNDVDADGEDAPIEGDESSEGETDDAIEKTQYQQRLAGITPKVSAALRDGAGNGAKLKAVLAFAEGKAAEGLYPAALNGLDMVAKLLAIPVAPPQPPTVTAAPVKTAEEPSREAKAFTARLSALLPRIKSGVHTDPKTAKIQLSEPAVFARKQDWRAANELVDLVEGNVARDEHGAEVKEEERSSSRGKDEAAGRRLELERRWNEESLESLRDRVAAGGSPDLAALVAEQYAAAKVAHSAKDMEAAVRGMESLRLLAGSPGAAAAESYHLNLLKDSTEYQSEVAAHRASFSPEKHEEKRREAASRGYGMDSDGMSQYALPISAAEWRDGALASLASMSQLLERAAATAAQAGGDAAAATPLMNDLLSQQHTLRDLSMRVHQYAMSGGFGNRIQLAETAMTLAQLYGEFTVATGPFTTAQMPLGAGDLVQALGDLAPALQDYAAPPEADEPPLAQLQQAIEAFKSGEFASASGLLSTIQGTLLDAVPEAESEEATGARIGNAAATRQITQLQLKLGSAMQDLEILAARKGASLDAVRDSLKAMDQLAKAIAPALA